MAYDRYRPGQRDPRDYRPDVDDSFSSARDYEASGLFDRDRGSYDRGGSQQRSGDGQAGYSGYAQGGQGGRDRSGYDNRSSDYYGSGGGYGGRDQTRGYGDDYRGSYGSDGRRFENHGGTGQSYGGQGYGSQGQRGQQGGYGRQPQGYDYRDRGFLDRSVDEVRSWFGDEEAERRREYDARYDDRFGGERDRDYHSWRSGQVAALDRDYDEYRRENRSKFENEFSSWRTDRQGQRSSLNQVNEHMDVVGSDGGHVGTVDKVRGDRIILTKSDEDAGGRHHSIPSRWIDKVDDKVTLRKTADEAQREWRDEERNQAFFSEGRDKSLDDDRGGRMLNRSFSGTY